MKSPSGTRGTQTDEKFDWKFYTQFYEDLQGLNGYEEAHTHWINYGRHEERSPSLSDLCQKKLNTDISSLPQDFDADTYRKLNPDIQDFCQGNDYKAIWHYLSHGKEEQRRYSIASKASTASAPKPLPSTKAKQDSHENIGVKQDRSNEHLRARAKLADAAGLDKQEEKGEIDPQKQRLGRIDAYKEGIVRGWALPDGHVGFAELDVYIDGIFVKTIRANETRRDLLKHNLGHGRNGFEIAIPDFWIVEQKHELDIRFKDNQISLKNSPIELSLSNAKLERQALLNRSRLANAQKILAFHKKNREVSIVIPVFNAYEEVKECVESVIKHTSIKANLLLIDDCSTDPRMADIFEWIEGHSNIELIRNAQNIGYTATINKGINLAKDSDIVLLNSDTRVGPYWLQNLQRAAYHDIDIATATAISDNAGAFSVPNVGQSNEMPAWLTDTEMSRAVSQHSKRLYPEVPTASGFCMYIRRDLLREIGNFDDSAFPRGYGEENDFCMRALRAGWRHVIDDSTLVYHVRSASFKAEKKALMVQGREVVDRRYPEYKTLTPTYTQSQKLQFIRYNVRRLIEKAGTIKKPVLPRVLYVISTRTGGTPQTNQDLMEGLKDRYHTFLLHCDRQHISLYDTSCTPHKLCERIVLTTPISVPTHTSDEYDKAVSALLIKYSIELLHIRHLVWHSLTLPKVAKRLNIPVIFSLHDFYTVCPTVNLLDENQIFCGGSCTKSKGECSVLLWSNLPPLKHSFIQSWQRMMAEAMDSVDAFVTTSNSAKEQLCTTYPKLKAAQFPVIPHGRDFAQLKQGTTLPEQSLQPSQPLRLLFPGNINLHKGAELIAALHEVDIEQRLEIHFLGTTDPILKSIGRHHGKYKRDQFFDFIQKIRPHYVGIFSIWPETYCHTLTESWASGVPVIALDNGAVGERIRTQKGGWLIDSHDVNAIYSRLRSIAEDTAGYSQKVSEVRQWQWGYGRQNDISTMSAKYQDLYQSVIQNASAFRSKESEKKRVKLGVFVNMNSRGEATPSTHVRVLDWLKHPDVRSYIDTHFLDVDTFLQKDTGLIDLEIVLVQRNTIKPYLIDKFIQTCRQRHLPIVFEIDDNLTEVPEEKDLDGTYARTATSIERIASAASTVITSTQPLAEVMRAYNSRVVVIPNTLPEFLWLRPEEASASADELEEVIKTGSKIFRVLYMGNPTHSEDIALLKSVFERFSKEGREIELFVIGGEQADPKKTWYQRIDIPSERRQYPSFVKWLKSFAHLFDLAVAPLTDTGFNRSKSALKYVQYSAMALPAIYSNCIPYSKVVNSGVTGFLANNDEESWYQLLVRCCDRQEQLSSIGKAAKEKVLRDCVMSNYTEKYRGIFQSTVRTQSEKSALLTSST